MILMIYFSMPPSIRQVPLKSFAEPPSVGVPHSVVLRFSSVCGRIQIFVSSTPLTKVTIISYIMTPSELFISVSPWIVLQEASAKSITPSTINKNFFHRQLFHCLFRDEPQYSQKFSLPAFALQFDQKRTRFWVVWRSASACSSDIMAESIASTFLFYYSR